MLSFELREKEGGFELTGGDLEKPLFYEDHDSVSRLVGFLSQKDGSELTIITKDGTVIASAGSLRYPKKATSLGSSKITAETHFLTALLLTHFSGANRTRSEIF